MSVRIFVNAYEIWQCYGGPEEGGWWYNAGTPLASVPVSIDDKYFTKNECYCKQVSHEDYEDLMHENDGVCPDCKNRGYTLEHIPWQEIPELMVKYKELEKEFEEEYKGNKIHRDQPELLICFSREIADHFPKERPRYE